MSSTWSQTFCTLTLTLLLSALCVVSIPRMPILDTDGLDRVEFNVRDARDDPPKPSVRDNGLGSLLLKNLRFRDLEGQSPHMANFYNALRRHNLHADEELEHQVPEILQGREALRKRSSVSVSQLAELLHTLRSRGVDEEGVKLQSLRFGK